MTDYHHASERDSLLMLVCSARSIGVSCTRADSCAHIYLCLDAVDGCVRTGFRVWIRL